MSDSHFMQDLAHAVSRMSDQMSVEQMRLYQQYVSKSLEAREAQEAFMTAVEQELGGDTDTTECLQGIRRAMEDSRCRLSGTESVLLACLTKSMEGEEYADTKRLNILLHSYGRKPSNTTKIIDIMEKKSWLEIRSDGLHAHKSFRLTREGHEHAKSLLARLDQADGDGRLAIA